MLDYTMHYLCGLLVLIYLHNITMMLIIRHFVGLICQIIEVIIVHKWWGPHVFQGSRVISTLEHVGEPRGMS